MIKLLSPLCLLAALLTVQVSAETTSLDYRTGRPLLQYDRGQLELPPDWKDNGSGPIPAGSSWVEYDFTVPTEGWYGLFFQNLPNLAREIFVDGERISLSFGESPKSVAELLGVTLEKMTADGWTKAANLPLSPGKHTLRFQRLGRMGFPAGMPRAWEIRAARAADEDRLQARIIGHRELRKGEALRVSLTSGHGPESQYEIYRIDRVNSRSERVATVTFPAAKKFVTKEITVPADAEGVFQVHAKSGDRLLTPQEFVEGPYFVVDTKVRPESANADASMTLLHTVDCVANTLDGRPVVAGENYWEANGATRIVETAAGKYRESNDGRGPEVDAHPRSAAENLSGFAYLFDVAHPGRPLIIEIEHPDDDWRSVCVSLVDVFDKEKNEGYLPPAYAYETGGYLPLSNTMLTEKVMFWPNGKQVHLGLVSSRIGKRSAASKIRIYEVSGPLPSQTAETTGRINALYMEEMKRWNRHFNTPPNQPIEVRDFIGLNRTMQWAAYTGVNAFWPTETAYQESTYDSKHIDGFLLQYYNTPRLSALLCEKYGMAYVAEMLLAKQRYYDANTMIAGAAHPEDLYTTAWWGYHVTSESPSAIMPKWNILHPHVQEKIIGIYGELADQLGDTASFAGMSGRIENWQWNGHYALTSLNWGYEDWTVGEFSKDTGIAVPGDKADPQRFEKRYRFLTSADMKPKWVEWRKARVTDYLLRLSARIRKAKKDVVFYLCGDANVDEMHAPSIPGDMTARLDEMGIDRAALAKHPGIAILPTGGYGRGKTRTYLTDQTKYDEFLNTEYVETGHNPVSGFAHFGVYQEWADEFPLGKLGMPMKRWWYCSGSDAAGLNGLERLSTVLAEQDTMVIRDGGYPLIHGRRDYFSAWMAEYGRLPRLPFTRVPFARDPVAVWERKEKSGHLFYAVNREQYPVVITLGIKGAGTVTRLGTSTTTTLDGGKLILALAPYELRAFRAPAQAVIESAAQTVPEDRIEFVRRRLAYAQDLAGKMDDGIFASSFTAEQKAKFRHALASAWTAFQDKAYWRARTLLASGPCMAIYEKFGEYPEGQVAAKFANMLANIPTDRFEPEEPFMDAAALLAVQTAGGGAKLVASESFNDEWRFDQVLESADGGIELELNVPVAGYYQLSVGHVAATAGTIVGTINGKSLPIPMVVGAVGEPEKTVFPQLYLDAGTARFSVRRGDAFGLYALKLVPVLKPLPTTRWSTVGPFKSFWSFDLRGEASNEALRKGADKHYPPEENPSLDGVYRNEAGRELRWTQAEAIIGTHEDAGVNFAQRAGVTAKDYAFAQTFIHSPKDQEVLIYLGSDWWANAYLNGELLKPAGNRAEQEKTGLWFSRWKPRFVKVLLKKGENRLLVKNQGGSMQSWFSCYITDPGDLTISATPMTR
jgi:hypothetical protein